MANMQRSISANNYYVEVNTMKKFIEPEVTIMEMSIEDVITTSSTFEEETDERG